MNKTSLCPTLLGILYGWRYICGLYMYAMDSELNINQKHH